MATDTSAFDRDSELVPIRELSRLTGVNPVTLRAWERRYGLLKPTRTPKGHRLYSASDVEFVREIQSWLARGVSIGKMRELLQARSEAQPTEAFVEGEWNTLVERAFTATRALNEKRLESLFNEITAIYPIETVAERFLRPLLQRFSSGPAGFGGTERAFLYSFLRMRLATRLYHAKREARTPSLLLTPMPGGDTALFGLCFALSLAAAGFDIVWFESDLPLREIGYATGQCNADAAVLYSDAPLSTGLLEGDIARLVDLEPLRLAVAGQCVQHQGEQLRDRGIILLEGGGAQTATQIHRMLGDSTDE